MKSIREMNFVPRDPNGFRVYFSPLLEKGRAVKFDDAPLIWLSSEDEYAFFLQLYSLEEAFPHIMVAARKRLDLILNKY